MIRGAEQEFETSLGDYKEVAGWYLPHSMEMGRKGSPDKSQISYERIEANVDIDDRRFQRPAQQVAGPQPAAAPDASTTQPKRPEPKGPEPKKQPPSPAGRPPIRAGH